LHQNKLGTDKKIKLFMKNNAFRVSQKFAIKRLEKIMKKSNPQIIKRNDGKKFLFNLIYGMYGKIIFWECSLAKALQMRGHDVKALVCGGAFTMCTSEYTIQSVHDDTTCQHCINFSKDFFNVADIPYSTYNDYISTEEIENIKNQVNQLSINECKNHVYKDVKVGALSINSVLRYFKGSLTIDDDLYESVLRSELINAIIATDTAEKVVKKEKPDVIISRHLAYSSWGSFANYCMNKGIRVCYPGEGYKTDTIAIDFDIKRRTAGGSKVIGGFKKYYGEVRKKRSLNKQEDAELQSFLDKRMTGKEGDTAVYGFSSDGIEKRQFDFDKYDKTFAIFPNLPWDSSLLNANRGFKDVYEWITYTIELFKEKPEYQLMIKIHPSENKIWKSENTVMDYINNKYASLPENIKIIPPDTTISPYSLFSSIDAGIVYHGTVGLEMALNNIPVVVVGLAEYGESGFTYDVLTKEEYKSVLFKEISSLPKQKELARIYAYYYFIKSFIPFNFTTANRRALRYGWNIKSLNEFAEGKNRYLDHICNYIAEGTVYQDW